MKTRVLSLYQVSLYRVWAPGWCCLCVFLVLYLIFPAETAAQNKLWDKTFGGSNTDELVSIEQTQDGGYILGGNSFSVRSGDKTGPKTGYWLVKLNADGTKVWDKTIRGSRASNLVSVQQTTDGGYILGATSSIGIGTNPDDSNNGSADYWLVKLDATGNIVWDKSYGGSGIEQLESLWQTSDGGFILGGNSNSGIGGDKTEPKIGGRDYWLVRLNADGIKVWDKTLGGQLNEYLVSLISTTDGGYLFTGHGDISPDGETPITYEMIKLNADATQVWKKDLGYTRVDALQPTPDGGSMVRGYLGNTVTKLSADGTPVWNKNFSGGALISLQPTRDGGYILGGSSASGIKGDKTEPGYITCEGIYGSCTTDYWVLKINADGSKEWDKTVGGKWEDRLTTARQTEDGGFILGGTSNSGIGGHKSQASRGGNDYWIVKLDSTVKTNQYITFPPILLTRSVGDPPFTLEATASSGLPVTFRVLSGPATISGNTITLTGVGTVHIQAYQPGNATYNSAITDQSFIVEERKLASKQWNQTYGGFNNERLTALVPTPDGGYLAGGYSNSGKTADKSSASKGGNDYWLTKLNNQGFKEWDKAYGGTKGDSLMALIKTQDGGILLGGTSYSGQSGDKSQPSKDTRKEFYDQGDYWIIKIDANGTKLWDKTYGGNAADHLATLIATPDGGFLLGGTSYSDKSGDKSQASKDTQQEYYYRGDYWVVKIDANGTTLWDKTFGGGASDKLTALVLAPEGGFLVGGASASGISGDKSEASRGDEDYWVLRLTEDGSKVWDKTFGGIKETYTYDECNEEDPANCDVEIGSSVLTALISVPDGGFLLGGYSNAEKGGDKTDSNLGNRYTYNSYFLSDYWIVKIDSKGTKVWDKTYGGINSEKDLKYDIGTYFTGNSRLSSIIATPDGDYLLAGTSDSDKGRDKSENARGGGELYQYLYKGEYPNDYRMGKRSERDYWVVKIDDQGTKKWDRTIGSHDDDALQAVVPAPNGSYILGGTSNGNIAGDKTATSRDTTQYAMDTTSDFWLVKIKDETIAAATAWDMRYGGSGTDNFTDAIKTLDGGYLAGGYTNTGVSGDKTQPGRGKTDYWIVKSDKNGKKLWEKRYGGPDDDYLNRVIQSQDGGYLLAGSSLSGAGGDKTEASQGDRDYWVVKVDATGNKQWDKRFGGLAADELKKAIQLPTGEYVLGGYSNSHVSGDKSQASRGGYDYWLVKISHTGEKLWDKRYGGNGQDELGSFTLTNDGGFLLGGSSFSGANGDKSQASRGNQDYWVVRTDKEGVKVWDTTLGGSGVDEVYSVGRTGAGFFIAGSSTSGKDGDKSQARVGGKDYWLVTLDSQGNKQWDRTFGGSKDDELRASTFTKEGTFVLAGSSYSEESGDKSQGSQGGSDYWVVTVDKDGNKVQDQRFGGSGQEELRTVFQTSDGGLLLGGRSDSGVSGDRSQPSQGGTDYWLVKLAPVTTSIVAAREATPSAATANELNNLQLQAYPNPFSDRATIRFALPETQQASVKVYDGQGNEVATLFNGEAKAKQNYQVEWKAGNKPAGLYFLQLQTPAKKHQQKLLLTK